MLRATFLDFATERRTLPTIGLANILPCCIFLDRYQSQIFTTGSAILSGLIFWFAIAALFWSASLRDLEFFTDNRQVALALIINASVVTLFFWDAKRPFLPAVSATLLILSNAGANPIMRGLSALLNAEAFRAIEEIRGADPKAKWIAYNDFSLAQLILATGAPVLNGNKLVPDFTFWRRLDPDGRAKWIYNRYANIYCRLPADFEPGGLSLFQDDFYILALPPDSSVLRDFGFNISVPRSLADAEQHGFSLVQQITPSRIWIYHRRE